MKPRSMLFLLLPLASCGDEPAPLSPEGFFQKRADEVCSEMLLACYVEVPVCVAGRVAEYQAEYHAALQAFRDFIPANAEACLAKVKEVYGKIKEGMVAMKAVDYQAMVAVCANVYRGSSPANEWCELDVDCLDNLICDKGSCATSKLVAPGALCANPGESCPQGSYCGYDGRVWLCTAKVGALGDCTAAPCIEALRCAGGVCVPRLDIAEACTTDGDCSSGFCEPYARVCAQDIRFAKGSDACRAMGGT